MESGDTWVCPYVLSSQGWVKASPVESWFREGLETNIAVESCGSPQSACPWHMPTLPVHVVAMRSCSHCCSFHILQPRGGESLIVSIFPLPGKKNKSKVITSGLGYSGTEEGRALPRQWALLTPAPWVRFLVSSKGLVLLQLYPQ